MQSAAYDLSAYEPKPRRNTPPRTSPQPQVRVISKRSPQELARPKALFKGFCVAALLASIIGMLLYSNAVLNELSNQIAAERSRQELLLSENNRLQASLESKMSLRSIEDVARTELGLSEMEPYQITYVNRCDGDKIVKTANTPKNTSFLDGISNALGSALEYLRISFNKN